jgi:sec-independent protein translocase protein TatA
MITPLELVVIGVVVVVFLAYGPKKIPELARSLAVARKEFALGSTQPISSANEPEEKVAVQSSPPSSENSLKAVADRLGIDASDKTNEPLSEEILRRANGQAKMES